MPFLRPSARSYPSGSNLQERISLFSLRLVNLLRVKAGSTSWLF